MEFSIKRGRQLAVLRTPSLGCFLVTYNRPGNAGNPHDRQEDDNRRYNRKNYALTHSGHFLLAGGNAPAQYRSIPQPPTDMRWHAVTFDPVRRAAPYKLVIRAKR